jgi:hypothetical protein
MVTMELIQYKEMREAIQRVRKLHSPIQDKFVVTLSWCFSCEQDYPCPTIKALDGTDV